MANTPRVEGFDLTENKASYTRQFDGRRAVNVETPTDLAADVNWRRNSRVIGEESNPGQEDYGC